MESRHEFNFGVILNETRKALFDRFGNSIIEVSKDEVSGNSYLQDSSLILSIPVTVLDKTFKFLICFPERFPLYFPDIFLEGQLGSFPQYPHIDPRGFICTVDKEVCYPDFKRPVDVVIDLIDKARNVLRAGMLGKNQDDIQDEFIPYWELRRVADIKILSFIKPIDECKTVFCYFRRQKKKITAFLVDSHDDMEEIAYSMNINLEDFFKRNVLYLPLGDYNLSPLGPKISDLKEAMVTKYGASVQAKINEVYSQEEKFSLFLSSVNRGLHKILFGWIPKYTKKRVVNGFRPGNAPFYHVVFNLQSSNEVYKLKVNRLDKVRLLERCGCESKDYHSVNIVVAGLGAVGSCLVENLVRAGFYKFILIDPDVLEIENIQRHLCGYSYVGQKKVEAVKKKLSEHFLNLQIQALANDFVESLVKYDEIQQFADFNIVAIGKTNIELAIDKFVKKDTVYMWVEPYAVIGHLVYISAKDDKISLKDFFDEYNYKLQVILNAKDYNIREAGCQCSFVPYSSMNVNIFLASIVPQLINLIQCRPTDSMAMVWVGDLSSCGEYAFSIAEMFSDKSSTMVYFKGDVLKRALYGSTD